MKQLRRCRKICKAYSAGTVPAKLGTDGASETAVIVVNGFLGGDGAPWAKYGEMLEGAYLARKVKVLASVAATLPISVKGGVGNPMD